MAVAEVRIITNRGEWAWIHSLIKVIHLFPHQSNTFPLIFYFTGPDDTYTESYAEVAQDMSN